MKTIDLDAALRSAMTTTTGPAPMQVDTIKRNLLHAGASIGTSVLVEWLDSLVEAGMARKAEMQGVPVYELIPHIPATEAIRQLFKGVDGALDIREIRRRCDLGLMQAKRALDQLETLKEFRRVSSTWDYERAPLSPKLASQPITGNVFDDYFGDGRMFSSMDVAIAAQMSSKAAQKAIRSALRSGYIKQADAHGRYIISRRTMLPGAVKSLVEARRTYYGGDESDPSRNAEKALLAAKTDLEFALLAVGTEGDEMRQRLQELAQSIQLIAGQVVEALTPDEMPVAA